MRRGTCFWIVLLSALALVTAAGAQAGDPAVIWNRTYGGPDAYDAAHAVVPDPGGTGFVLAGETASPGAKTDAWVIRLVPDGGEEWNRTYGGEEGDAAHSIIRTSGGNLLLAGNLTLVTNGTEADTDAWLVMMDPSGGEAWNRTYGGPNVNASANAVVEAEDGGYVFVGSTALREGNESSAWVVRVNETGTEVWNRTFGGAGENAANAVTRIPGGDFVVAGTTGSSGAGMADVWVARLNGSGTEVWNRTFGSPDDDAGRAVINTSDGNLLVAGTFTERPDNTTADTDALLIKLTPDGDILWNWIYGDFGVNETAAAAVEVSDGGYLFAGETAYPGVADTDAWLVATDADGAVAWSRTFGGVNPGDAAASLIESAPGEFVFAGTFNATESGGAANMDAWVVKLGPEPTPTPTPTATPTPAPTAAPAKPQKAPIISQKPPVPAATVTAAPSPVSTGQGGATAVPTGTAPPSPTGAPTGVTTPGPTGTTAPTATPTVTAAPSPTVTPAGNDDDDDDDNDDDNNQTGGAGNESLSGTVWFDLNGDGARDPGEPGIPEISVRLIGQRTMLDYTATGPDGSYRFGPIPSVGYAGVEFVLPDGYSCTVPGLDNHAAPLDTDVIFAEGGVDRQTLNAGLVGNLLPGTPAAAYGWVLGTVWSDGDRDGVRDEAYGLTDVGVRLLDADGNVAASTRTRHHDSHFSMYLFGPLPPGEYSVAFTAPDGYAFTSPGPDSHADPSTGATGPFAVGGGEAVVRDAGLFLSLAPSPATPPGEPENEASAGGGTDDEQEDDEQGGPGVTDGPEVPGNETVDDGDAAGEREPVRESGDDRNEVRDDGNDDRNEVKDEDDREAVKNDDDDRKKPDAMTESGRGDDGRDEDD
ncbi:collagen-binding protein [Methanoculleus sediminis]|uniref:Collagen-binding protein n=2 Tax=Methanoculleus sediminis TaxID=1550566 RepID=A0A0H1R891_9EURY|nr:collagen-binding protein [Methanoculleus sediminis]